MPKKKRAAELIGVYLKMGKNKWVNWGVIKVIFWVWVVILVIIEFNVYDKEMEKFYKTHDYVCIKEVEDCYKVAPSFMAGKYAKVDCNRNNYDKKEKHCYEYVYVNKTLNMTR